MLNNKFLAVSGQEPTDPQFNYVTMLLHGDGTNGNQNNTFLDSSSNAFTVTRNGNVSQGSFSPYSAAAPYSTLTKGGSAYFDGNGDYLSIPQNSAFSYGTGDFTIEGWIYITGLGGGNCGFFRIGGAFALTIFNDQGQSNELCVFVDSPRLILQSNTAMSADAWNHFAVSKSSGTYNFYINGSRVNQISDSTSWTCSGTVNLGTNINGNEFFPGYLCDIRVSNVARYTGTTMTVPTAPLTAISNTQALFNFTNAAIFDNALKNDLETVGNAQISTSVKKYGTGAIYLDGTGDWLYSPADGQLPGDFTVEYWFYRQATASQSQYAIGPEGTARKAFMVNASNQLQIDHYGLGQYVFGGSVPLNTWTHIAFVRVGSTVTAYVNGTATGTTQTLSGTFGSAAGIYIGAVSNGGATTTGYIDDLRITKGYARYTANFTPPTAALPDK